MPPTVLAPVQPTGGHGRPGAHYHTLAGSRRAAWLSFGKLSDVPLLQNDNQAVRSAKLSLSVIGGANMARFDNKVVLVSGGARGQGAAEARMRVPQGAKVVSGGV